MNRYDYRCEACGHEFEAEQRMSDAPLLDCPECRYPALKRVIKGNVNVILKGGGFHCNDYPKGGFEPAKKGKTKSVQRTRQVCD